jgi:hypothetical protein
MTTYGFRLVLDGLTTLDDDRAEELFRKLGNDGSPKVVRGAVWIDVDREAGSFREAVTTAIRDVEAAGEWAVVERVEPDDVSSLTGLSAESVTADVSRVNLVLELRRIVPSQRALVDLWRELQPV